MNGITGSSKEGVKLATRIPIIFRIKESLKRDDLF